jgi:hydrogenase maturation factor
MTTAGAPRASRDRRARQSSDHPLLPLASAPPRLVPECHDDVCITCSDEAVPVRVVTLLAGELATVDTGAGLEEVSVALVEAAVGDTVLVHAKEAIAVVRPERR